MAKKKKSPLVSTRPATEVDLELEKAMTDLDGTNKRILDLLENWDTPQVEDDETPQNEQAAESIVEQECDLDSAE